MPRLLWVNAFCPLEGTHRGVHTPRSPFRSRQMHLAPQWRLRYGPSHLYDRARFGSTLARSVSEVLANASGWCGRIEHNPIAARDWAAIDPPLQLRDWK